MPVTVAVAHQFLLVVVWLMAQSHVDYTKTMPRKMRRAALRSALSVKASSWRYCCAR